MEWMYGCKFARRVRGEKKTMPLNILYWRGNPEEASKQVRVIEPLTHLARRNHVITSFEDILGHGSMETAIDACDMVLINNVDINPGRYEFFRNLVACCNTRKKLIIHDFDDLYREIPDTNPYRKETLPWDFVQEVFQMAHIVTVTGKVLKEELEKHHPRVFVTPNMVDSLKFRSQRPRRSSRLRIGWAGGPTHLTDLSLVTDAVRTLQKRFDFDFVIYGMFADFEKNAELVRRHGVTGAAATDSFHREFINLVNNLEGIRYTAVPVTTYSEFPAKLAELDLDVGLCPIEDQLFNRCRSAIKFYQYAAVGTVTLASNVYPYDDEPVLVADNTPESWTQNLEALLCDRAFRENALGCQVDYVMNHRNLAVNVTRWEALFETLIQRVRQD
jgi:O-antigen biosynthesis protein